MIEIKDSPERISVFRYPPIAIKCPQGWVDEAVRFDNWCSEDGNDFFRTWNAAKRISKRSFAAYFGLESQFLNDHHKWSRKKSYLDYTLTHDGVEYDIVIQAIPVKDYKPRIGKTYTCNVWKSREKQNPIIHIFCAWWTPIVFICGWINNSDLKDGKQQIREFDLNPMYSHPMFINRDTRGMYV